MQDMPVSSHTEFNSSCRSCHHFQTPNCHYCTSVRDHLPTTSSVLTCLPLCKPNAQQQSYKSHAFSTLLLISAVVKSKKSSRNIFVITYTSVMSRDFRVMLEAYSINDVILVFNQYKAALLEPFFPGKMNRSFHIKSFHLNFS